MIKYLLLPLLSILTIPLQAQITADLDTITVTATRISSDISESGKNVTVLTTSEIESMPVTSVDELFRSLPGVNINSRQGFGVQADVGVRGSTYSQVLFMLDNVPLNDPLTAHFNTNIPVSLSEIAQIELIRGPAAASFGADAVGGVIHIKTKAYMLMEAGSIRTESGLKRVDLELTGGQNRLFMSDAALEIQLNRTALTASVRTSGSPGETLPNPAFTEGISSDPEYNTRFSLLNATIAKRTYLSDNLTWYMRGGADFRDFNARYFYTRSPYDESEEEIRSLWALSALTYIKGQNRTELNISHRNVEDIYDFNSSLAPANVHTTGQTFLNASHQIELQPDNRFIHKINLMGGAQSLYKTIASTDRGNHDDLTGGLYLISAIRTPGYLSLNMSLRLQFDEGGTTSLLPSASVAYNRGLLTLRGSAGRAVRTGDYTERYISSEIPNLTPLRNIGNPDLRPETSTAYDLGFDLRVVPRFRFSSTFFLRNSSNLIDYALTSSDQITNATNLLPGEDYFYAQNISESTTTGLEVMGTVHLIDSQNGSLKLEPGYTYIHTSSSSGSVSRYIANHPSHQLNMGVGLRIGIFQLRSQNELNVRSPEAEQIVNGRVDRKVFISNLKASLTPESIPVSGYISVMNLTDTEYQEILGAPMPGRWFMAGLKYRLN